MSDDQNKQTSKWLIHTVVLLSGLALGLTLVLIAWNSALEENKKEFSFESSKIREAVTHNVQVSNGIINTFTTSLTENESFDDQVFQSLGKGILDQNNFIEGVFYSHFLKSEMIENPGSYLKVENSRYRDAQVLVDVDNIHKNENFENALKSLLVDGSTEAVVSVVTLESSSYYILLKPVFNKDSPSVGSEHSINSVKGILYLLINPEKMMGNSKITNTLLVKLHSESSNLGGRKLIFTTASILAQRSGFLASSFNEDASIQFPLYSVKLSIAKDIYWPDVNQKLIYIALFIGLGITLLLMALVRAKDLREKELNERNVVIESKVEEQTKELALARDQALEGSRMKSDFLASMSHEIRTPLTAIIGMAELLSETKLNNDQAKYVNVFRKAGDTLLNLVNDILDLSKIEAEQLVLENISFNLLDIVEEAVEIYAIKAAERHVELISRIDCNIDIKRIGDPARLRQIILNLISNAIKFTEKGHIVVRVRDSAPDELLFSVSDTGVGIPDNKQQAIFESFTQADSSTTRKYGGTGLGLTISNRLVDMMQGRIWVESEIDVGSTFLFTVALPVNISATRTELHMDGFLKDKKALVIDANEHNRIKICDILRMFGAEVVDVEESLIWEELSAIEKQKYQYVFLDYRTLRECSDKELERFKQSRQEYSSPVIIAMLGPVSLDQKTQKVNEFGLDGYLVKPIKQSELLHVFSSKSNQTEEAITNNELVDSEDDETSEEKKRILLVEDNGDNRLLVTTYLKKSPYVIDEAENGEIAVDLYRENIYNLILMDVQMPIMDGHEATRAIRVLEAENGRPSTPIIALTAHAIKEEVDKCMAAGCNTHVGKPIKKSTLLSVIESYVS
jgi:signal transduction histidine kinase/CheY-like chemotaxis protein